MSGMTIKGVEPRAVEVKQAANRLHWEVEWAMREGTPLYHVQAALGPLAEALGILRNVMEKLDEIIPDDAESLIWGPMKERFVAEIQYYTGYHEIAR